MIPEEIRQFLIDSAWMMPGATTIPHACLEYRALRASWLKALASAGIGEDVAYEGSAGLWRRAPDMEGKP